MWSESGRLQLFWDSPIVAGAVLAALAPWCFLGASCGRGFLPLRKNIANHVVEGLLVLGCTLTQSRGPLLALAIAYALVCGMWSSGIVKRTLRIRFAVVVLVATIGTVLSGGGRRISAGVGGADASISNRLTIWSSSSAVLFEKPWTGLGSHEAGEFFSQWLQPEELAYRYTGIFNDFLQIGIELGLIYFGLALYVAAFVVTAPLYLAPFSSSVVLTGFLSTLILIVCGSSTILIDRPEICSLWVINITAVFYGLVQRQDRAAIKTGIFRTLKTSICIVGLIILGLWTWSRNRSSAAVRVSCGSDHTVLLTKCPPPVFQPHRRALVYVDRNLLGLLYGKEIRHLLLQSTSFDSFLVKDPRHRVEAGPAKGIVHAVIFIGVSSRFSQQFDYSSFDKAIFINPPVLDLKHARLPVDINIIGGVYQESNYHVQTGLFPAGSRLSFTDVGLGSASLLSSNLIL